jgi:hypothetical protein
MTANDGRSDFDFLHGRWTIAVTKLVRPLRGSNEWTEFEARKEVQPILGGLGNVDRLEALLPDRRELHAVTLRVFDPATRLWSIYWVDNQACVLQPPTIGRFTDGRGEFIGDDMYEGIPIRVAIRWTVLDESAARLEQAFSTGTENEWEPNLRMALTKVD